MISRKRGTSAHRPHPQRQRLAARYRCVAARRGAKKAVIALAHALHVIAYHVILRREPYHELGEDYLQQTTPATRVQRLIRQLSRLGFEVERPASLSGDPTSGGGTLPSDASPRNIFR